MLLRYYSIAHMKICKVRNGLLGALEFSRASKLIDLLAVMRRRCQKVGSYLTSLTSENDFVSTFGSFCKLCSRSKPPTSPIIFIKIIQTLFPNKKFRSFLFRIFVVYFKIIFFMFLNLAQVHDRS